MDPIISPAALKTQLAHVRLFDARPGSAGAAAYAQGHLPGAVHADLDTQLAAPALTPENGGRHPLPRLTDFALQVGHWGITPTTSVVVYDDQNGANAAARLWWMLKAIGHHEVRILDGGIQSAIGAGIETTTGVPVITPAESYPAADWKALTVDIEEVNRVRERDDHRVLDVRAAFRFNGEREPIDPVAGHIPGARNMPLTENLDSEGRFKSAEALRAHYSGFLGDVPADKLYVHCGSGVTACHTLVALERAGIGGAKLYVGSWSEWCRQAGRPKAP